MVRIDLLRDATLIRLAVTSTDKNEAAEIANKIAEVYSQRRSELQEEAALILLRNITALRDDQQRIVDQARENMLILMKDLAIENLDLEGPPFSANPGNGSSSLPPAKVILYNNAKADWQRKQEVLRAMNEGLETARQVGLMSRRPATILERATEPPDHGYSRYWFWRPVAIASAGVGGFLLVLGWVLKRRANRPMLLP